MKIELKGICKAVSPIITKTSGTSNLITQSLIITVAGFRDSFGQQVGKDEDWEVQLLNANIEKHKLLEQNLLGKPLIVECFLNSRNFKSGGEDKYALNLNLSKVTIYTPQANG